MSGVNNDAFYDPVEIEKTATVLIRANGDSCSLSLIRWIYQIPLMTIMMTLNPTPTPMFPAPVERRS
jgi:hypothetical protein